MGNTEWRSPVKGETNCALYNALAQVGRAVAFWSATWQGFESLRHYWTVYGDLCSSGNRVNGTHRWWSDDAFWSGTAQTIYPWQLRGRLIKGRLGSNPSENTTLLDGRWMHQGRRGYRLKGQWYQPFKLEIRVRIPVALPMRLGKAQYKSSTLPVSDGGWFVSNIIT